MATTCGSDSCVRSPRGTNVRMLVLLTLAVIRPCSSRNMHAIYHTCSTEQQSRVVVLVGKNVSRCSLTGASCVHLGVNASLKSPATRATEKLTEALSLNTRGASLST